VESEVSESAESDADGSDAEGADEGDEVQQGSGRQSKKRVVQAAVAWCGAVLWAAELHRITG
jgi:hypothetical protein